MFTIQLIVMNLESIISYLSVKKVILYFQLYPLEYKIHILPKACGKY